MLPELEVLPLTTPVGEDELFPDEVFGVASITLEELLPEEGLLLEELLPEDGLLLEGLLPEEPLAI